MDQTLTKSNNHKKATSTEPAKKQQPSSANGCMWDYEAPQFCDFSDTQTFNDNVTDVDKFFMTDHESKENISDEFSSSSIDADVFRTPMTLRDGKRSSSGDGSATTITDYYSPKVVGHFKTPIGTPKATTGDVEPKQRESIYELRQTPLRNLYQNGGAPLQIKGQTPKPFGNRRKSRIQGKTPQLATNDGKKPSSKSVHFIDEVTQKLDELTVDAQPQKPPEVKEIDVDEKVAEAKDSELLSEDEEEAEKLEETVLENNNTETEEVVVVVTNGLNHSLMSEDGAADILAEPTTQNVSESQLEFHNITDQELEKPAVEANENEEGLNASQVANSSRRSSYIVKSPSIRIVHFNEDTIEHKELETIGETAAAAQVTPTVATELSKKIKNRQQTPLVVPSTCSATSTTATAGGLLKKKPSFNQRFQKYIKRLSNKSTPTIDEDKTSAKGQEEKSKKRVTIAVPSKTPTASTAATNKSDTVTKTKRPASSRPRFSFARSSLNKTAAAGLARSKSMTAAPKTGADVDGSSKPSPYLGLAVLNSRFMSSVRHYSPFAALKPKVTVPRAPRLLTEQRMSVRKYHTLASLKPQDEMKKFVAAPAPSAPKVKVNAATAGPSSIMKHAAAAATTTKPMAPLFSTDNRLKVRHMKQQDDGTDGAARADRPSSSMFKARPVPNFKRMQALEEKRKRDALERGKRDHNRAGAGGASHKPEPFSFESRAHGHAKV